MEKINLSDIALATGGRLFGKDIAINSIGINSKDSNELFIPIIGERFDAHDFINDAIKNGAKAIVSSKILDINIDYVLVDDTKEAILNIADLYIDSLKGLKVVAITGSVGKTTTKEMVYSILKTQYNTIKTQGNFNNEIGMPLTIFRLDNTTEIAILEMGMSGFGEIEVLSNIAKPDTALITNIGVSHSEHLGSREGIAKAKLEILSGMKPGGKLILNKNEALLSGQNAEYFGDILHIKQIEGKSYITALYKDETIEYTLNALGEHNAINSLGAIYIAKHFDISWDSIKYALENFSPADKRQNIYKAGDITIIDDTYNASPESMRAALGVLATFAGVKVAVLGSMGELGELSSNAHTEIIEFASDKADIVLCMFNENCLKYKNVISFNEKKELVNYLKSIKKLDVILFKGSRFMKMEECINLYLGEC